MENIKEKWNYARFGPKLATRPNSCVLSRALVHLVPLARGWSSATTQSTRMPRAVRAE